MTSYKEEKHYINELNDIGKNYFNTHMQINLCLICVKHYDLQKMTYTYNNLNKQKLVCLKCYNDEVCKGCNYITGSTCNKCLFDE